jgi:uncharacterized Fe-S cluster protein YjdI
MASKERVIEYEGDGVTVIWKPHLCIHSEKCVNGLPEVFKPKEKRWIQTEHATAERIINQIKQCPSGALAYKNQNMPDQNQASSSAAKITIFQNGPLMCEGPIVITKPDGTTEEKAKAAFCRCGESSNKPYCDGSHQKVNFQG